MTPGGRAGAAYARRIAIGSLLRCEEIDSRFEDEGRARGRGVCAVVGTSGRVGPGARCCDWRFAHSRAPAKLRRTGILGNHPAHNHSRGKKYFDNRSPTGSLSYKRNNIGQRNQDDRGGRHSMVNRPRSIQPIEIYVNRIPMPIPPRHRRQRKHEPRLVAEPVEDRTPASAFRHVQSHGKGLQLRE